MQTCCFLNGEIIPIKEAQVSIFDRGIFYGDGLFETVRVYRGIPFLVNEHVERLTRGADLLGLKVPGRKENICRAVEKIIDANSLHEGVLRLTLTRGFSERGLWPLEFGPSTFFVTSHAGTPYTPEQYRRGFRGTLISFPLNEHSPLSGLKTLNCLDHVLGRKEAVDRGCDEGIFLNQKHYLAEGTVSNLFLIKGRVVYTPPLEAGILPGITRALVIKLADKKIKVHEQNISPLFLKEADEAFLTNSLLEAMPLVAIEDEPIGTGEPGPVTSDLQNLYREYLNKYLGGST